MLLDSTIFQCRADEGAARLILARVAIALDEAAGLDGDDPEALHDFRVSVRRLRSNLRSFREVLSGLGRKKHRSRLRDVQVATGGGRDAEVAASWLRKIVAELPEDARVAVERLIERLDTRREESIGNARGKVASRYRKIANALQERFGELSVDTTAPILPTFGEVMEKLVHGHIAELILSASEITSIDDEGPSHRTRIATKRLRYLVECLAAASPAAAELTADCKRLQKVLGQTQDVWVLNELLDEFGNEIDRGVLAPVQVLLDERRRALFQEFCRDFADDGFRRMFEVGERIGDDLMPGGAHEIPVEIERKFLLSGRPEEMPAGVMKQIDQGWLPGERLRERLRRTVKDGEARFHRTVKLGRGLSRIEIEEETTPELFSELWPLTAGCRVEKRRHVIEVGSHLLEIDEFTDRELWLAEVELQSEDEEFELPQWLAAVIVREVTEEDEFVNLNLAR